MTHIKRAALTAALILAATASAAAAAGALIPAGNAVIDQAQASFVDWIVGLVVTGFFGLLAWIAARLKIKVVEYFNRNAITAAATNFANSVIDELQARYLASASPDLSDLIIEGAGYVRDGSRDAIKEGQMSAARLETIVTGALKAKGQDTLTAALRQAGGPVPPAS